MSVVIPSDRPHARRYGHSSSRVKGDSLEHALGWGVELLLALVLILSPLAFGSVEYWAQWWMMLGIGAALVCLLVRWIAYPRTFQPVMTAAYVPMALFLFLAVLQIVALPAPVLTALSPKAALAWNQVGQLLPAESIHRTISIYPLATQRQFRLLLLVSAVFFIVLNHLRDREQIVRLLWAIVLAGMIVGAIAISQNLSDDRSTWMGVPTTHPDSGPFMNHSAFGQFMNLAIGAALALLLIGLKRQIGSSVLSFRSLKHHLIRKSSATMLLPLMFVLIAPVLVALSMTRGGVLSIVIAGAVTAITLGLTQSGKGKRSFIAILAFLVLLVMLKFGFDTVYDRMATLRNVRDTGGGVRLQMVRDMLPIVRDFPIVGVGLGAFSHVFPSYDSAAIPSFATHAENEYAQLAVETGVVGVAILLWFLAIVLFNTFAAIRFGRRSIHAGSIGLAFGLVAILIHSASDFGQHVPAIACVTATVAALLVRLGLDARSDRADSRPPSRFPTARRARILASIAVVAILPIWLWMFSQTTTESDAEAAWMRAQRNYLEMDRRGLADASDGEFILALQDMTNAAQLVPGDADYRFGLNVTRWQSIDRYDRSLTGEFLSQISAECMKITTIAPYFGPAISFAGQIRVFDLGDEAGIALIRRGYDLARYSREGGVAVALLDARDGKWDSALVNLRRAIELGYSRLAAADLLAVQFSRTDLAVEMVEGSRPDMVEFANTLNRIGQPQLASELLDRATHLLIAEANRPDAPVDAVVQLADAYIRDGQHDKAIPLLRRALAIRYDRSEWRTTLIHSLVADGQADEALREARTNFRLNPGNSQAKQLLEDILTAPTTQLTRPKP